MGYVNGTTGKSEARPNRTRLAMLTLLLIAASGCVAPKRATLIIPGRCMHIQANSFTRPCIQRADGKLVCDGVVVTASCTQVSYR